jgi:hypothetical protein
MALDRADGTSSADGDGATPVVAKRSFSSFQASLLEGGSPIAVVTGLDMSLTNNLEAARVVGAQVASEYFEGRCNVTGTINAFFEDAVLMNKFLNETPTSLQFTLTDPDANTLTFLLPRIIYTGGEAPVPGEGGIVLSLPFQATFDSGEATALKVTRS